MLDLLNFLPSASPSNISNTCNWAPACGKQKNKALSPTNAQVFQDRHAKGSGCRKLGHKSHANLCLRYFYLRPALHRNYRAESSTAKVLFTLWCCSVTFSSWHSLPCRAMHRQHLWHVPRPRTFLCTSTRLATGSTPPSAFPGTGKAHSPVKIGGSVFCLRNFLLLLSEVSVVGHKTSIRLPELLPLLASSQLKW